MRPQFFFAIGSRPQLGDIEVALAVGQTAFLVPGCASVAARLACHPDPRIFVARDSPIFDPQRPSLERYADAVATWSRRLDRFAFALSYDDFHDRAQSLTNHMRLCRLRERLGVVSDDDPVVPVAHRGGGADIADFLGSDSPEWDDIDLDLLHLPRDPTPVVAFGGLAFTQYHPTGMSWLASQLHPLSARPTGGAHLLGLSRPDVVRRSGVVSFDSSRPAKQAAFGWKLIAPSYQARFGISPDVLQNHRRARLAYWLMDTRDRCGLPWTAPPDTLFLR